MLLARAGLDRFTPRAAAILLLAANAPDCDVVSALGGSLNYLHYHRHITHSLLALPVLALACVAVVRAIGRKPINWRGAYFIALIGVGSHLLLDLTNIYGVRILLPFSGAWLRWDITGVIDFWIWAALLLAVFAPMLSDLVSGEIGAVVKSRGGARRGFAIAALVLLVLYDGGRAILHGRAAAMIESRIYGGAAPLRSGAFPLSNIFEWRGIAETAELVSVGYVDVRGGFTPSEGHIFYKPEPSPALDVARRTTVFQEFLRFSQFPFWRVTPGEREGTTRVEVMDLRFGDPQSPGFVATAIVDANQHVRESWFQFGQARPR